MFKAVNSQDGKHIIILNPEWVDKVDYLRSLDRKDILVCQSCEQPVRVRAGEVKRWHFAHKQLKDCPLQNESITMLAARAILYNWLVTKFDASVVTLEKEFDRESVPRLVDCWIETKSHKIAYWIIESQMKPQQREKLKRGFERQGIEVNWIFLTNMMNENNQTPGQIFLSTTEREFMHESEYNFIGQSFGTACPGASLHYLDCDSEILTTYRSVQIVHRPQLYTGRKVVHHLSEMLVLGKTTGELIHPGEYEQLRKWKQAKVEYERKRKEEERKRREKEKKRREEREKRERQLLEEEKRRLKHWKELDRKKKRTLRPKKTHSPVIQYSAASRRNNDRAVLLPVEEAVCELCGNVTTKWYAYDNKTKKCKCMDCYRRLTEEHSQRNHNE